MTLSLLFLILGSAIIHASWNAIAKSAKTDPLYMVCMISIAGGVASLPFLAFVGHPNEASMPYIIISGIIHVIYFGLLGQCYRLSDFSAVYPIFRGGAPLLTAFFGGIFLSEWLKITTYIGIIILVLGLLLLSFNANRRGKLSLKAIGYALLLALTVATYTVLDGHGARLSGNPFQYALYSHIANVICIIPIMVFVYKFNPLKVEPPIAIRAMIAGAASVFAYSIVLYAMVSVPIGVVSALRETSVIFAAIIGWLFLGEKLGKWHFISAILIVIGLMLIKGLA